MLVRFLRTASSRRLLGTIGGAVVAICVGTAIAVAAAGSGPTPPPASLAQAVHRGLGAKPVRGISADITFTDNLIDSSNFAGQGPSDPLLQGGTGRLWASGGGRLRIELQSGSGDIELVVDHGHWWLSDPSQGVVYTGTSHQGSGSTSGSGQASGDAGGIPTVGQIQIAIRHVLKSMSITGPSPTDVGGQPAYSVTVSPKSSKGLIGSLQLAWDAVHGTPLQFNVYARGDTTPVLGLTASSVSYGPVPTSVFTISPPAGSTRVPLGGAGSHGGAGPGAIGGSTHAGTAVSGVSAVAAHLPGRSLHPPATLLGEPRTGVHLTHFGGGPGALVTYGHGLGTIAVIEQRAGGGSRGSGPSVGELSLPTRHIDGGVATILSTPLGSILSLTTGTTRDTIVGSITGAQAQTAAQQFARPR